LAQLGFKQGYDKAD